MSQKDFYRGAIVSQAGERSITMLKVNDLYRAFVFKPKHAE
jgi:hypothetical protein